MQQLEVPELKNGRVVWVVLGGKATAYIIQSISPARSIEAGPVIKAIEVNTMKPRDLFPGDLGHPDYVYDGRPCCLFTSYTDADARKHMYNEWLQNKRLFNVKYPALINWKPAKFEPAPEKRGFDLMVGRTIKSVDTTSINVVHITFTDGVVISIDTEPGPAFIPVVVATNKY